MDPISRGPQRLADGKRRQYETVRADAENQSLDGGERQRQFHEKSGADTGAAVDLDSTPKPFDVPPHYVHADSASRHFGHATRGGKTRTENQRVDLRLGRRAGRFQEVLRNGPLIQLFGVEPRPVVGDRDDDIAPFVIGAQRDTAMSGLAVTLPCLIILDAVINAVAQHMHERVADFLHDVAIEFCLVARRHQVDALARLPAQIAYESAHALKCLANRHQPHGDGASLQIARDSMKLSEIPVQAFIAAPRQLWVLLDHRLHNRELTDQIHEAVQLLRVHFHAC